MGKANVFSWYKIAVCFCIIKYYWQYTWKKMGRHVWILTNILIAYLCKVHMQLNWCILNTWKVKTLIPIFIFIAQANSVLQIDAEQSDWYQLNFSLCQHLNSLMHFNCISVTGLTCCILLFPCLKWVEICFFSWTKVVNVCVTCHHANWFVCCCT